MDSLHKAAHVCLVVGYFGKFAHCLVSGRLFEILYLLTSHHAHQPTTKGQDIHCA